MPIGKNHALLFQDAQTYTTRSKNGVIHLSNVVDIDRLNESQVHNAKDNILFSDHLQDSYIEKICAVRGKNIKNINVTRFEKNSKESAFIRTDKTQNQYLSEGCNEAIIVTSSQGIPSCLRFSGMNIIASPKFDHIENSLQPPIRDQIWTNICLEMMDEIECGNLEVEQSLDYIQKNRLYSKLKPVIRRQISRLFPPEYQ